MLYTKIFKCLSKKDAMVLSSFCLQTQTIFSTIYPYSQFSPQSYEKTTHQDLN